MKKIIDLKSYLAKIPDGDKAYFFLTSITEETQKGRHDISDSIYVNVVSYETKDGFDGIFERHRECIDLHVIIQGEEKIYYGDREDMTVTKEYDETGDYELLKGDKYSFVEYGKKQGIEFPINEPHMAGYADEKCQKILKAIVKIKKQKEKNYENSKR